MRVILRVAGLFVLTSAFVVPVIGADDKKDTKKEVDPLSKIGDPLKKIDADIKAKEGWVVVAQLVGKVIAVQGAQKAFTIQVTNRVGVPNQAAINRIGELRRAIAQSKDINNIRNWRIEMAQQEANVVTFQEKKQDIPLVAHEDVKVRVSEPPTEFNDKGEQKRYTKEETAKLRGPGNLWGFPAEFDNLAVGTTVQAIVARKKVDKTKKKSADDPPNEPVVTEIRIKYEAKPPGAK